MYESELQALKKFGRFRERKLFDERLIDLASNDYLGLSHNKKQFKKAVKLVKKYDTLAPKASMLVNGYHPIHKQFEETMAEMNGFEQGLVVGSGFLANMALIESLVRKHDRLFIDEEYHASGMMAAKLLGDSVVVFKHNDADDLREKLVAYSAKRQIIAVEGVYSMGGDLCSKEIFDLAERYEALLIVDEAHSSGVLGKSLLGIFEYHGVAVNARHIKMGTLGKAYGSYGAYILGSREIISFLENRAKPIIYSTAPSVIDTALALVNIKKISQKSSNYAKKLAARRTIVAEILGVQQDSTIVPILFSKNCDVVAIQNAMIEEGYLVGAIRQPTVRRPIIRLIPRLGVTKKALRRAVRKLQQRGTVNAV